MHVLEVLFDMFMRTSLNVKKEKKRKEKSREKKNTK